jgi:hypothetical protein
MQRLKHGTCDIPVEVVGFQVQGIGICQQLGQTFGNFASGFFINSNVNGHGYRLTQHNHPPVIECG